MNSLLQRDHFALIKTNNKPPVLEASPDHLRNNLIGLWNQVKELRALIGSAPKNGRFISGSLSQAWMNEILIAMVKKQVPILSLTPGVEIVTVNNSAVKLSYTNLDMLMVAVNAAVQGQATKAIGAASDNTGETFAGGILGREMTGNLSATQFDTGGTSTLVFGWRVRVMASELNFARRPIVIDVGPMTSGLTTTTIGTPVFTALAYPTTNAPIDIIILSVSNASGLFTIVPGDAGNGLGVSSSGTGRNAVVVRGDAALTSHYAVIESLNARDLIKRFGFGDVAADDANFETANRDGDEFAVANRD